jgi:hypothetical protein
MKCPYCNIETRNLGNHTKGCNNYKNQIIAVTSFMDKNIEEIKHLYIDDEFSVSEVGNWINEKLGTSLTATFFFDEKRGIKWWMTKHSIYRGVRFTKRRSKKTRDTTLERHGVMNIGCTKQYGWNNTNKIEYDKISYLTDKFYEYENLVKRFTNRSAKLKDKPAYCEYTGIMFIDTELGREVNPNDPRKRSIDHKIPTIWGYLNHISPEVIGGINNLAYVLRYVNTIKANTLYESFIPMAIKMREVFKNEGYKSN